MWKYEWNLICRLKLTVCTLQCAGCVCGSARRAKQMLPCSPSSSLSHLISSPFSTASLVFFAVVCQMITWILHWVRRFISQHAGPDSPPLPVSTYGSLSPDLKIWPCDCTYRYIRSCDIALALHRRHLNTSSQRFRDPFVEDFEFFHGATVRSCLLLIYLSVCADILDVDLSWPVFIWIWGEQRSFCCVLRFGLPCVFLEGRGARWGWSESSRGLRKSQYSLQNMLEEATEHWGLGIQQRSPLPD